MKDAFKKLMFNLNKTQRLLEPIISPEQSEIKLMDTSHLTEETIKSEYTDYSLDNLRKNINSIRCENRKKRIEELCEINGFDINKELDILETEKIASDFNFAVITGKYDALYSKVINE